MTDKPDTNLPGSKPEAGGVEGVGAYTDKDKRAERFSASVESGVTNDKARRRQDGGAAVRLDADAIARMNASY